MATGPTDPWATDYGSLTPEAWSAIFAGGTLLVAILAAVFALIQIRAFFDAQWEHARPYLVVDFVFRPNSLMQVEIRNISHAAAADVRLTVDPPFRSTVQGDADTLNYVFSPEWQLDLLAPSRRILHTLDVAFRYFERADFPQVYTVTAVYRDANARTRWSWRKGFPRRIAEMYEETFRLSFAQWSRSANELDNEGSATRSLTEISKSLSQISSAQVLEKRPNRRAVPKNLSVMEWLRQR
jgi:hypothetical protein